MSNVTHAVFCGDPLFLNGDRHMHFNRPLALAAAVVATGAGLFGTAAPAMAATDVVLTFASVPLAAERVSTGVQFASGETFEISGYQTGTYGWEGGDCSGLPTIDVTGARFLPTGACGPKFDLNAPVPSAPVGTLIGRIAGGAWFVIGAHYAGSAETAGELELRTNDTYLPDNDGIFAAIIKREVQEPVED